MTVRLHDTDQPDRRNDAGRGPGATGACVFLALAIVYLGLHGFLAIGQAVAEVIA